MTQPPLFVGRSVVSNAIGKWGRLPENRFCFFSHLHKCLGLQTFPRHFKEQTKLTACQLPSRGQRSLCFRSTFIIISHIDQLWVATLPIPGKAPLIFLCLLAKADRALISRWSISQANSKTTSAQMPSEDFIQIFKTTLNMVSQLCCCV